MNAWYMLAAYVGAILICLALCAASLAVMMHGIVKQRRLGGRLAFLIAAGAVTAAKVGIKLAETARKRQVLCITHLAQIAALAQTHMLIEKQTDDKRTYTRIVPLDHEGRKQELARIMDGGLTESGLKAAEEMLSRQVE